MSQRVSRAGLGDRRSEADLSFILTADSEIFCNLMPSSADNRDKETPLCVDLDGTLIHTDMMWESLSRLLKSNPLNVVRVLAWWTRGRARLKAEIAARATVDASTLPYNQHLIEFIRAEKSKGRRVLLVTASDGKMADQIATHLPIFDEVLASDGKRNLRGRNKGATLAQLFGERGFDYAGNSRVDLPVWEQSRKAVVVNGSPALQALAAKRADLGPVFPRTTRVLPELLKILTMRSSLENLVVLIPFVWLLLTSQQPSTGRAALALGAFLLCTWGKQILREFFNIESDRRNPGGRLRPFASGALNIHVGPILGAVLVAAGLGLALSVGWGLVFMTGLFSVLEGEPRECSREFKGAMLLFWTAANGLRLLGGWMALS